MNYIKTIFILGVIIVLICSLTASFNHTLALFRSGGQTGGMEWCVTIAAETSFLMGVLSRFSSRLKGTKPHGPANFMFFIGLIVVGWSNWESGAAHGVPGIIKGLLIPFFVFGAEAVLAREYMDHHKQKESKQKENAHKRIAQDEVIAQGRITQSPKQERIAQAVIARREVITQPTAQAESAQKVDNTQKQITRAEAVQERITQENAQVHTVEKKENTRPVTQERVTQNKEITQPIAQEQNAQKENAQENAQEHIAQTKEVTQESIAQNEEVAQKQITQGKVVFLKDKIAQTKINDKLKKYRKADAIAHAIKCAITYEQQHKDLPTKRDLMDLAGCTDHQAKEALKIIREVSEELSQTG